MSQLVNHKPGRFTEAQQRVILAAHTGSCVEYESISGAWIGGRLLPLR